MISTRSLEIFKEITTIPRESGHEGPMTAFLQDFARSHIVCGGGWLDDRPGYDPGRG